ncbi:MAG TPA: hypothetical protein VFY99_09390, partial [Solirubrobacterales bacterium]
MTVTFAEKLARIPHYDAGMSPSDAKTTFGADDAIKLASNESAWPPHSAVVEAVARAASESNRYPDQH